MLILRPTAKLANRMKATLFEYSESSTGRLGDWYANLVILGRQQFVLAISEKTLLPVVLRARDVRSLPAQLPEAVAVVLAAIGLPARDIELEQAEMDQVLFAKTASRRALGSLNDFANLLAGYAQDPGSLLEYALKIGEAPCTPLGMKAPIRATLDAWSFGVMP
jgi:hypothetical protein